MRVYIVGDAWYSEVDEETYESLVDSREMKDTVVRHLREKRGSQVFVFDYFEE